MADQKDITELHNELRHIENKDAKFTEWEKKRLDTLHQILNAEPELRNLLVNLDIRQRKEISALAERQKLELRQAGSTEHIYSAHKNQHKDLEERHDKERQRYTREHQDAKVIREEMREREKRQELERGMDGPKRTR
ncbi:MAG: hypothetical protein EPN97_07755 [Alphaproteobacteria bacterium]|nr:MAG: hypothetical protein EPN97_07755 [Alphaproteobacteria bacterium]